MLPTQSYRMLSASALSGLILLGTVDAAVATDYKWRNPVNGNWNNAANWTPTGVPGNSSGDSATIDANGNSPYAVTIDVAPSKPLARLTVGGPDGTSATPALDLNGKPLTIDSTTKINRRGSLRLRPGSKLTNNGTLIFPY
jgi:hypothetical protein